jgi:hypothetical protein
MVVYCTCMPGQLLLEPWATCGDITAIVGLRQVFHTLSRQTFTSGSIDGRCLITQGVSASLKNLP